MDEALALLVRKNGGVELLLLVDLLQTWHCEGGDLVNWFLTIVAYTLRPSELSSSLSCYMIDGH